MEKFDSFWHDLVQIYNEVKNYLLNVAFEDVIKSKFLPPVGMGLLLYCFVRMFYSVANGRSSNYYIDEKKDMSPGKILEETDYENYATQDTGTTKEYLYDAGMSESYDTYDVYGEEEE